MNLFRSLFIKLSLALLLVCGTMAIITPAVLAQGPITVTTTIDELNGDGDCSLREAIQAANTDAVVDACNSGSGVTLTVAVTGNNLSGQQIVNTPEPTQSSPADVISGTNSALRSKR